MTPKGSNDKRLTDANNHNLIRTYIGQPLVVAASDKCSNTVKQRMISEDSNDERLTNIDTCNCYICK